MKKLIATIICILSCTGYLFAQQVISSAGESVSAAGYDMSWTLGEPVIATLTGTENILTQGFHQTKLIVTPIFTVSNNFQVKAYPNPATQRVFIEINPDKKTCIFELYDLNGKLLKNQLLLSKINEVNVETLSNGTYILKIFNNKDLVKTFRLVKMY